MEPDEPDEGLLIARARRGDVRAFEALYRANLGRVYGLCLRMTGNRQIADDCTQDTFIRAWQRLASFEGRSAFSTWLHRIAVNEVLALRRRDKVRDRHLEAVRADADAQPMRGATTRQDAAQIDIEDAIGRLPQGARDVFVLFAINGYSHEETANFLGVAVGTCKAQLHRARKLLRDHLSA